MSGPAGPSASGAGGSPPRGSDDSRRGGGRGRPEPRRRDGGNPGDDRQAQRAPVRAPLATGEPGRAVAAGPAALTTVADDFERRPTAPAVIEPAENAPVAPSRDEPPVTLRDADGEDVFQVEGDGERDASGHLANLAGIKFQDAGAIHEFDAGDATYKRGDRVVVESDRGPLVGTVAAGSRRTMTSGSLRRILRKASTDDDRQGEKNEKREREAWVYARERIRARNMPLKLIRAEYPLQGSKVLFYFASEERIDFRDLVKDLGTRLKTRVEMRQVGARDEAKMVGGIGSCGRELCCSTFLPSFAPVSIKMAKDQGLVLNPNKVAGQCGRLKCCLVYEQDLYVEMRKTLPKIGKRVRTPGGDGRVLELDVLRQRVRVGFEEGGSEVFPSSSIEVLAPPTSSGGGGDTSQPR